MNECPYCGEPVKDSARKCRHCGEWLDDSLRPLSPSHDYDDLYRVKIAEDIRENVETSLRKRYFWLGAVAIFLTGGGLYTLADNLLSGVKNSLVEIRYTKQQTDELLQTAAKTIETIDAAAKKADSFEDKIAALEVQFGKLSERIVKTETVTQGIKKATQAGGVKELTSSRNEISSTFRIFLGLPGAKATESAENVASHLRETGFETRIWIDTPPPKDYLPEEIIDTDQILLVLAPGQEEIGEKIKEEVESIPDVPKIQTYLGPVTSTPDLIFLFFPSLRK